MGMDPATGEFARLRDEVEKRVAEEKGWVVFRIGELVSIKGQQFRVVGIVGTHVVLRSRASEVPAERVTMPMPSAEDLAR